MPPQDPNPQTDEALFSQTDPFVDPPISVDHGLNLKVGKGSFINFDTTILDTCLVGIGERVLFGPHIRIYGATHPMDPALRKGLEGPEGGKEVHIEDDVWVGGSAIILAGVRIGRGSTVGAGSVVTKVFPMVNLVECADLMTRMFPRFTLLLGIRQGLFVRSKRAWIPHSTIQPTYNPYLN